MNLFGHEHNPNLQNLKDKLRNKLDYISNTCKAFDSLTNSDKYQVLLELTALCTEMNQRIRTYNVTQKMKLESFLKWDNSIKNVDKAISACKANLYTSAIWIKKALKCNLQLCKMMAMLQHNLHLFKTSSTLDIHSLHNGHFLYDSNYVSSNVTFTEYPNLIKRYSDLWYELLCESVVSSDTAYNALLETFDCDNSVPNKGIVELRKEIFPLLEHYSEKFCTTLCELPLSHGEMSQLSPSGKFSVYHYCQDPKRIDISIFLDNDFQETSVHLANLVEEGFNFLCVEASEIFAFVATDSDRILKSGIPPHIPVAYDLRGHSMSNDIVCNIRNDIQNELKLRNTSVLCEVYDRQFHDLIVRSDSGKPLTRIQNAKDFFRDTMDNFDKKTLISNILPYSKIDPSDLDAIKGTDFHQNVVMKLNTVTLEFKCVLNPEKDNFIRKIFIKTNAKGNFSMEDFVTNHHKSIWNRYLGYKTGNKSTENSLEKKPSHQELRDLIKGTKLHRQISSQNIIETLSINSDCEENNDPDYSPNEEISEFSDIDCDGDVEINNISIHNISNVSTSSSGRSCIKNILDELKKIQNKHNWMSETIDTLLDKYFKSKSGLDKLFLYEMDVINSEVYKYFRKYLFKKTDNKHMRVKKLMEQLKEMPQLLNYSTSDEESVEYAQPKSLFDIFETHIMKSRYPKEYLAALHCKINHYENVIKWESDSKIPIRFDMPWVQSEHIIFNYPDYSLD